MGIARMAAASPRLAAKRSVEYFELAGNSLLNLCNSPRMPFRWTINPYRGCEFGCKYCYARYTHEFMGLEDPREFEEKIYSKKDAALLLRRELQRDPAGEIAIGTATDPYQPAERVYATTREILEVLNEFRGLRVSITSKSDLILRDVALLQQLGRENELHVHLTVTTLREDLARLLEPRAPRPALRLRAVRELSAAGIWTAVFAMPVMPGITDGPGELERLAEQAAGAGAAQFATSVLFLRPSAKAALMPFLEVRFPALAARYRRLYAHGSYLRGEYEERLAERVAAIRRRHGWAGSRRPAKLPPFGRRSQLELFPVSRD